jgi:hypothetical protein
VLDPAFTDLFTEVLLANPQAIGFAVGPEHDATWQAANARTGDRLRALGALKGIDLLLAAADVLLDTWPASGATMMLDAGLAGLPVVSLGDGRPENALVRPPVGTLGGAVRHATTAADVAQAVREVLTGDSLGDAGRAHVLEHHSGAGWRAHLEEVVALAVERAGCASVPQHDPPLAIEDWECVLHLLRDAEGFTIGPEHSLVLNQRHLPKDERPASLPDARDKLDRILASAPSGGRRALAMPAIAPDAIAHLLDEVRALIGAGEIASCTVAVPAEDVDQAIALLEAELSRGDDVDLELVTTADAAAVARPEDVVLA